MLALTLRITTYHAAEVTSPAGFYVENYLSSRRRPSAFQHYVGVSRTGEREDRADMLGHSRDQFAARGSPTVSLMVHFTVGRVR
jgi:hypothetical protein